jgi:hypothetical protein
MQNISLLYDFEIDSIAQEKSLSVLPLIHHVLSNWPDADWQDVSYTISEHVKAHGFSDFPAELLSSPEVEDVLVDLPPRSGPEVDDDMPDLELFDTDFDDAEPELAVETINVPFQPKRVERLVDVREILQQVKRGNL